MGASRVTSLTRDDIGSFSLIQAQFDDAGTGEPIVLDAMRGPCRVRVIDIAVNQLFLFDDKDPIHGETEPDYIFTGLGITGQHPSGVLTQPFDGIDFSIGLSFTMVDGFTSAVEGPSIEAQVTLIVIEGVAE